MSCETQGCLRPVRYTTLNLCRACYQARRRAEKPDMCAAALAEWRARPESREVRNAHSRTYSARHPERRAALQARRYAASGHFTVDEWQAVLIAYGGRCRNCAADERIEVDHIVPVHLGGTSDIWNIQPLCRHCNASKGVR